MNFPVPDFARKQFDGVRVAGAKDHDSIYSILMELHNENAMFSVSEKKVHNLIDRALSPKSGECQPGVIGIIDGSNGIEGTVGIFATTTEYSDEVYLCDQWNFVRPQYRNSSHAKRMMEFSKWCAIKLGVPLIMGVLSTERTEAKIRLYRRQFPYVGGFFAWGISPKHIKPAEPQEAIAMTG